VVLGFALGGFFDGILLHQILQWHHLLSLVPAVDTLRAQVLWDGYFHALMYVIAAAGLWGLWRVRRQAEERWGRALAGALLAGLGLWHVVDAVLSHWLLGIHRIKLDSPNPLMWDLMWLAAFGVLPLILGWVLLRKPGSGDRSADASFIVIAAALVASGLAAWSLQPPKDRRFTTIVFAPWVRPADAMNAVLENGGRLMWADRELAVMVVEVPQDHRPSFYSKGALLVRGSGLPSGCFGWSRT
jgi:uncharacterized membrane protein